MKQTNLWSIMMMLVLVIGTSISLSSCSKDNEEEEKVAEGIVGTWKYNFDGENGYCLMTFKADGTGIDYEYDNGRIDSDVFTYVYDESTNMLNVKWPDEKSSTGYYEGVYTLEWIDNNTFKSDISDEVSIWKRQ